MQLLLLGLVILAGVCGPGASLSSAAFAAELHPPGQDELSFPDLRAPQLGVVSADLPGDGSKDQPPFDERSEAGDERGNGSFEQELEEDALVQFAYWFVASSKLHSQRNSDLGLPRRSRAPDKLERPPRV